MEPVLLMDKPVGVTPLEMIQRYKLDHPEYSDVPMTYAGRLDPMASGLLIVLAGEECKKKDDYLALDKTYEATILFGVETDSLDLLGRIREFDSKGIDASLLKAGEFVGRFEWEAPIFSSIPVNGKPLHEWTRLGRLDEIAIPKRPMNIKSLVIGELFELSADDIRKQLEPINEVVGDFRQEEILNRWNDLLNKKSTFTAVNITVDVGSGTYIRTLAKKLGEVVGSPAIASRIHRTRVGEFTLPS